MIDVSIKHKLGDTFLDVDVSLPSSGITAVFGRSGAGKSSFINLISGLIQPDMGNISIDGRTLFDSCNKVNVPVEKRNIGYVFQDARLFPHYSVKGNLLYGQKGKRGNTGGYFQHIVELLNLSHLLNRYPVDLSGGEKQRVAIARALLSSPDILLMDEPLASLDLPRKKEVMPFLEKLSKEVNIPILYVTHSMSEILRLADHILLLSDGKVAACGTLESVWGSSVMRPWQSFSEQSSLFEAQIAQHHSKYALTKVLLNDEVGIWVQKVENELNAEIRLQIRANDVSIALEKPKGSSIRNIISAKVVNIEVHEASHGKQSIGVQLELTPGCLLWATITQWALDELGLEQGQQVYAQIKGVSVTQRDIAMKPLVHADT